MSLSVWWNRSLTQYFGGRRGVDSSRTQVDRNARKRYSIAQFERLELRELLSTDPILTVITHGFGSGDVPEWAGIMAQVASNAMASISENHQGAPRQSQKQTVTSSNGFAINNVASDTNLTLTVSWPSVHGNARLCPKRLKPVRIAGTAG
jgi:hypothetical protein